MSLLKILLETSQGLEFKKFFAQMSDEHGEFQDHITKSIPSYSEQSILSAKAIGKLYSNGGLILDIGSSEGYWGDEVVQNGTNCIVHSLDPNWKMKEVFDKKHQNKKELNRNKFLQRAFGDGFFDDDENKEYKEYKPINKYDVVRESMTFQFLSTNRKEQYGLCKQALKRDGLFITNSKIKLPNQVEYDKYEKLKDDFKRKSFSEDEIQKKAKEILPNMSKYMVDVITTFDTLQEYFKYVVQYWVSGNFHGFVASDSEEQINKFLNLMPKRDGYPNSVEGKIIDPEVIYSMKSS